MQTVSQQPIEAAQFDGKIVRVIWYKCITLQCVNSSK